jgi:chromosome segregation ATPase
MADKGALPGDVSPITDTKNGDLESKLSTYKQKLKILKKAFIEEQNEKEAYKKQLVSSYTTIDKFQKDLDEKEQKYLRCYKENQELHDSLISARSAGGWAAGSSIKPNDSAESPGNTGVDGQSHKNGSNDSEVLKLKLKQLESKITEMEEDHEKFEQKLYEKKSEIMEMKSLMKEESSELKSKIRDLEYRNEILTGDREANEEKVKQRISELETEKQDLMKEQEDKMRQEIERINSEAVEEQSKLKQQILELGNEGITRTDEFLRSGVEMDKMKDELTTSLEKEVKLNNQND